MTYKLGFRLGEWYGKAPFSHPTPASTSTLATTFPWIDGSFEPTIVPNSSGESIPKLYSRVAHALRTIISAEDKIDDSGEERAVIICTHAASMIAMGRALTGRIPADVSEQDFSTYTAGITTFKRRKQAKALEKSQTYVEEGEWQKGGVCGGWD